MNELVQQIFLRAKGLRLWLL